jgi:hypothetical protein
MIMKSLDLLTSLSKAILHFLGLSQSPPPCICSLDLLTEDSEGFICLLRPGVKPAYDLQEVVPRLTEMSIVSSHELQSSLEERSWIHTTHSSLVDSTEANRSFE